MDVEREPLSTLVAKFSAQRPLAGDAASVFAMWAFAAEHWAQAAGANGVVLGRPSAEDEAGLQQAVSQMVSRVSIPAEYSNLELVPEVLVHMGANRLLPSPDVAAHIAEGALTLPRHFLGTY